MNTPRTFSDLPEEEQELWHEKAINYMIDMAWLPLNDDVWATDKYADRIQERAEEMWERSISVQ